MLIIGDKYKFTEIDKLKKYNIKQIDENSDIEKELKNEKYKIIVLNTDKDISKQLIQKLTKLELEGVEFLTIEHFFEKYLHKIYIPKDGGDLSFLDEIKPFNKWQYFLKRVVDFSIAIPLAILTTPVMLYSVYRIKKESPDGGIFFTQNRIGKNGKPFKCIKFRTMRTDIEYFNPYTQENDPRIFPWSATMRKTRIDELPQLINVLKGDMHIIGPRAEWDELVKKYEKEWPFYHSRHIIAPGITGWAQVNYPYGQNIEDTYQKLMYDLYYIKNWSLWLEMKTIFKTILVMVGGKGL
jgi:lipopolysaccharide/colanic/teichoic acid biosynthesis glycosyltransferase